MPLKTFEGPSVGDLLAQIRTELGQEAVILDVQHRAQGVALTAADPATAEHLSRPRPAARPSRPANVAAPPAAAPVSSTPDPVAGHTERAEPVPSARASMLERWRGRRRLRRRTAAPAGPLVLAFVGPTGAGKTTTVAKLAAHPQVFAGARVGILNLDTYRLGASEQIAQHAALGGVPIASAYGLDDLRRARRALRSCEVVLVDCPGRGPQLRRDLTAVGQMLEALAPAERHLVMPVGTQPALVRRTIDQFAALGITHLLATKVDEMPDDWILFDVAAALGLPMRWLADGQTVPQDLRTATARLEAAAARRSRPHVAAQEVA